MCFPSLNSVLFFDRWHVVAQVQVSAKRKACRRRSVCCDSLLPAKKLMVHGVCWFQWLIDWFKNKWDSQMTDWDETDSLWIWKYPVLHFIFDLLCFLLNLLVFHPRVAERSSISAFSSNAGSGPFEALISAWASLMAAFLIDSWVAEIGNRFLGISGSTRYFDQKIYGLRP